MFLLLSAFDLKSEGRGESVCKEWERRLEHISIGGR